MEVKEAIKLKKELEADIFNLLIEFQRKTGATPKHVYLDAVDVLKLAESAPQTQLRGVSVSIEL